MLLEKEKSALLLIDVQDKLTPHVQQSQALVSRCQWLMNLAHDLNIPCLVSEQYPQGLGQTVEPLRSNKFEEPILQKVQFSCYRAAGAPERLQSLQKSQLVLIGIETHVCVLQTALDLHAEGFSVFVVVDAVSSRSLLDYKYALKRMKQAGIYLVTSEMVFFEWIGQAGTAQFRQLSKAYLQ